MDEGDVFVNVYGGLYITEELADIFLDNLLLVKIDELVLDKFIREAFTDKKD